MAKQTDEVDIFDLYAQLKDKAPAEETKLTGQIQPLLDRLNMVRTQFLGKPELRLSEPSATVARATTTKKTAAPPKASGPSANYDDKKSCPVCGNMKGHDGRLHRTHKEAFSAQELAERGVAPPDKSKTEAQEASA